MPPSPTLTAAYYILKPLLPRPLQIFARRLRAKSHMARNGHHWPIWEQAAAPPPAWPGWPGGKKFALVLAHDVESADGVSRCHPLAKLEEERGLRSTFGFVPLLYQTPERLRRTLVERGFEINVQGLYHDGKDFGSRRCFERRRGPMNDFLRSWDTRGFSTPSSLHNLAWLTELDIDFDLSMFDIDPFEPQPCHFGSIFPFWVQPPAANSRGFVEIPNTLVQDFTLFILLREQTNEIWRRKLDWIAQNGGLALLKTHPDYMAFGYRDRRNDRYPVHLYTDFLDYVRDRYNDDVWLAKPSQIAQYWRELIPASENFRFGPNDRLCRSCCEARNAGWFHHYALCAMEALDALQN